MRTSSVSICFIVKCCGNALLIRKEKKISRAEEKPDEIHSFSSHSLFSASLSVMRERASATESVRRDNVPNEQRFQGVKTGDVRREKDFLCFIATN